MVEYFPDVKKIEYEGPQSKNPFSFKYYNPKEVILGKTMAEQLRFAVCYWHTFKGTGSDPFGPGTIQRAYNAQDPMQTAEQTLEAAFEFMSKLGWNSGASMTATSRRKRKPCPKPTLGWIKSSKGKAAAERHRH